MNLDTSFNKKETLLQNPFWQEVLSNYQDNACLQIKQTSWNSGKLGTVSIGVDVNDHHQGWISFNKLLELEKCTDYEQPPIKYTAYDYTNVMQKVSIGNSSYLLDNCFGYSLSAPEKYKEDLQGLSHTFTHFHFYMGAECKELIKKFVESDYTNIVQELFIGNSSYFLGKSFCYNNLVEILSQGHYPKLEHLYLGDWMLFCNASHAYGDIGNITELLKQTPHLTHLNLCGSFSIDEPINLLHLTHLEIKADDDVGIHDKQYHVSQKTLDNLLNSDCTNVTHLYLDIESEIFINDKRVIEQVTLPDKFIKGISFPNLKVLDISGDFVSGELDKLENSAFIQKNNIVIR